MPEASAHPYIPNSAPRLKQEMLQEIGVGSVDELYGAIPEQLLLRRPLALPPAMRSELELRRHLEGMLSRNESCKETLSFLGGGCWQHDVPAVVDEVLSRGEFVTAYYGESYTDHGKMQALFEFASLIGELVELDAVSQPTYDWASAAATAVCMCGRVTGRHRALVPASMSPERLAVMRGYCRPWVDLELVPFDPATGLLDTGALQAMLGDDVACVYLETPGYLGTIETQVAGIGASAHAVGAKLAVGVDPISLGVLEAPPRYGADVVCGEVQPLGIHMHFGGGLAGFVATPDDEAWIAEYPTFLVGMVPTVAGEYGFGEVRWERMSYVQRGESKEYGGTTQNLWAIGAAVYLSLLGPQGIAELGRGIAQRAAYAARRIGALPGVAAPALSGPFFKEFVVDFSGTGKTVSELNAGLRERGIYGGKDLSTELPGLGQAALYCVTEIHTKADIDRLAQALSEVI
ncbi:MAG: aminomethyl-transferring glycine dehydrogenase subunit GcvPA [Gaiellales bacterium]